MLSNGSTFGAAAFKMGQLPMPVHYTSGNELAAVAPELGRCTTLRRLVLDGNPLRSIRQNLLTGPTVDLLVRFGYPTPFFNKRR